MIVRIKRLLAGFSASSGLFLFALGCTNFYLAFRASSVPRSRVTHVTNYVDVVSSPTNSTPVAGVDVPLSSPSGVAVPVPPPLPSPPREVANYPYQYFIVGRRIGAQMFNRYYYDGSPCSYGRIERIFPDRILLVGGDWIRNSTPDGLPFVSVSQPVKLAKAKESKK